MKCPNCGIQIAQWKSSYNDIQINEMMSDKSKEYKNLLKNIIRKVRNSIPSNDNKKQISNFISNAMMYDYKTLDMAINNYIRNAYMYEGKGFNYLLKVIRTFDEDKDRIIENEKKRFGTSPPVIIWDGTMEEQNA
jgi:transcriptional regulator NrdR family protein|tara:strand:- start:98 stop:502 length:405 start_codon:yes stop_codon:yes gene_type:complete